MIPVVSIVGKSGSGKTKFITKLVPELKRRGYKIAVIKHDVHSKIDLPDKDTWRMSKAGAKPVLIAGPKKMAFLQDLDKEISLDTLVDYCAEVSAKGFDPQADVDLVLTEGYKKENKPKIEVYSSGELLSNENELLAVVSEKKINLSVPRFSFKQIKNVADLIEKKYLSLKKKEKRTIILVNGQRVPLNFFVQDFMRSTVLGMVKSLKRLPKKIVKIELTISE